jgi:hypothetical protein
MKTAKLFLLAIFALLFLPLSSESQSVDNSAKILVILDCSSTMSNEIGGEKMFYSTTKELVKFFNYLGKDTKAGLMVFGHTTKECDDAELIIPYGEPDAEKVRSELAKITPTGNRGLIDALEKGLKSLSQSDYSVIYAVTSGKDQCGDRVYYLEDVFKEYGRNVNVIIIGIDVEMRDADELQDIASLNNGIFKSVAQPASLEKVFRELSDSTKGNVLVTVEGDEIGEDSVTLRIFNNRGQVVQSTKMSGFYNISLESGTYDFEIFFDGTSHWQRQVFIQSGQPEKIAFDLDAAIGDLKIEIFDLEDTRLKGDIKVFDENDAVIYEGEAETEFLISLPEGFYTVEVKIGEEVETFDFIEVEEKTLTTFPAVMNVLSSTAEITLNNVDGIPVHGSIVIENAEGKIIADSEYSSTLSVILPPGYYKAIVSTKTGDKQEEEFYLPEGDNLTVDIVVDVPLGSIVVELKTPDGYEVWGRIKVFDDRGHLLPHFDYESIEESQFAFDLPAGVYRIQAEADGVIRTVDGVQVSGDEETVVEIVFPGESED